MKQGVTFILRIATGSLILIVAACATHTPAPVVERLSTSSRPASTAAASKSAAAPSALRDLYHTVKPGDTLYSIALEYGQDYRQVALWNNLENAGVIRIGQTLRVSAPAESAGVATATPVTVGAVHGRPVNDAAGTNSAAKAEPKGDKVPYSDQAYARMSESNTAAVKPEGKLEGAAGDPDRIVWIWPAQGKVLESFNETRNKGLDIGGKSGDPVVAAADGHVVYCGNGMRGYGNMVVVAHNDKYLSVYAHNDKILVEEKQQVRQGQKIALMGASDTDRPKLHFEIRYQGKPTDPEKFLPDRK